ncbi:hypothetical protein HNR26_003284 [Rhizobium rosettiformans]|uniref:Uncharacterized protein n=2 Tax=Rhizobium rosettiformans TaxID=1368430 RepID=A0A7W8HRY5_9HYPH|nr:hypothetical protein [Rhizobium rosettiformans]MBB5277204.1 hypothetical protein [Rhizobium rosettiformans]
MLLKEVRALQSNLAKGKIAAHQAKDKAQEMELSLKAQLNRDLLAGQLSCEINSFTGWRRCLPVPTGFCEIGVYGGFFLVAGA